MAALHHLGLADWTRRVDGVALALDLWDAGMQACRKERRARAMPGHAESGEARGGFLCVCGCAYEVVSVVSIVRWTIYVT